MLDRAVLAVNFVLQAEPQGFKVCDQTLCFVFGEVGCPL
jgi:hypothetical protein